MRVERLNESATLYCGDCRDLIAEMGGKRFDALVTDPPYGIGESAGKAATRTPGLTAKSRSSSYLKDYGDDDWDAATLPDEIAAASAICRWQIIFGGNYYPLPPTSCWLVWDKLNGETDFADCELAWTNLPKAVRRLRYLWNGMMRMEKHIPREHPTQKPVGVMKWCIGQLPSSAHTIFDPFMGSGTTGVAAIEMGKHFVGVEREPKYFDIACRRIGAARERPDLFVPKSEPSTTPSQSTLI